MKLNYAKKPIAPMLLFDLSTDLREENNIANQYPEVVAELEQIMKESALQPSKVFNFGSPDDNSVKINALHLHGLN